MSAISAHSGRPLICVLKLSAASEARRAFLFRSFQIQNIPKIQSGVEPPHSKTSGGLTLWLSSPEGFHFAEKFVDFFFQLPHAVIERSR
jgi:hypothetical protein